MALKNYLQKRKSNS